MTEGNVPDGTGTVEEQLRKQLEEKDIMLSTLKSKTKLYIQKLQKEGADKLEEEKENVKQLQGKVEAARAYISKQRDQCQVLTTSNEALTQQLESLQTQNKAAHNKSEIESERLREEVSSLGEQLEEQRRASASEGAAKEESSVRASALEEQLEQSRVESERLREEVSSLGEQLEEQRRASASEGAAKEESSVRASALEEQLEQSRVESERLREEVSSLGEQLEEQRREAMLISKEKESVSLRLVKAKAFFHDKKMDEDSRREELAGVVAEKDAALLQIDDFRRTIEDLKEENDTMKALRATITNEKATLSIELENSSAILNEFMEKNEALEKEKKSVESDSAVLREELEKSRTGGEAQDTEISSLKLDVVELANKVNMLNEDLENRNCDLGTCQEKLTATIGQCSQLQTQAKKYQIEIDSLNSNLESEILQNQDRKKKIRVYVDKLTADKASLQEQLDAKKTAINSLTEDRNKICTQLVETSGRLKDVQEEFQIERDELTREIVECKGKIELIENEHVKETETLQNQISYYEKQNTKTLQQAEEKMMQSNQEVSEHKSKRLAARSEMIGLAQAMEKAQQECSLLQDYIAHSLVPIALEQVAGLESAVRNVESATSLIHKKKSMMIQKKASNLLTKSYPLDDTALDVSGHPISKQVAEEGDFNKSSSQKYMEKVKYLESEMERVRGGVKLLSRSVERLNEAIVFDSRCCGGFFDTISYLLGSCFEGSQATVRNEYSSVQMQSLDDSGHDSRIDESIHDLDSSSVTL